MENYLVAKRFKAQRKLKTVRLKTLKKLKHHNFVKLSQGLKDTINWNIKNEK